MLHIISHLIALVRPFACSIVPLGMFYDFLLERANSYDINLQRIKHISILNVTVIANICVTPSCYRP